MTRFVSLLMFVMLLLAPTASAQVDVNSLCTTSEYMPSRLVGGMVARVVSSQPITIYADFTTDSAVVGEVAPGAVIPINSAPRCADGVVWWQSNFRPAEGANDTPFGWLPEGRDGEYWLEPHLQVLTAPAARAAISAANAAQLQQVAQVEYGMASKLVWSPDGSHIAISTVGAVWLHDVMTPDSPGIALKPNNLDSNRTSDILYSSSGDQIVTVGSSSDSAPGESQVIFWSAETGDELNRHVFTQDQLSGIGTVTHDLSILAAGDWEGNIVLWNLNSGESIRVLEGHSLLGLVNFTPDDKTLISAGGAGMADTDMTMRIWDVETGTQKALLELGFISTMVLSPDGSTVAAFVSTTASDGTPSNSIQIVDIASGTVKQTFPLEADYFPGALSFSADESILGLNLSFYNDEKQGWDGAVLFLDSSTGAEVARLSTELNLRGLSFSPDGTLLALTYADPEFWGPDRVTLWAVPA